ncbi:MAG: hypothetical protein ABIQ38_06725 [Ilumatobacteraceae bacterium]
MSEWNPRDPDTESVRYDLSEWSINQRADIAAMLADATISHSWDDDELLIPVDDEDRVDAILDEIETPTSGSDSPPTLQGDEQLTEYELDEWSPSEREKLSQMLNEFNVVYRWEGDVLLVPTSSEDEVDECLDSLEKGGVVFVDDESTPQASTETLRTLFNVAQRLQRNPLDADGLTLLAILLEDIESHRSPHDVPPSVWRQATDIADQLAAALADESQPDELTAIDLAGRLHALLRPHV